MKSLTFSDKVIAFTDKNAWFLDPCHVLVAVSGGPDSMALLHLLTCWPKDGMRVSAVHMNHGLRGETAQRDEDFVRQYCMNSHIPLTVFREDVAAYAKERSLTLEEAGRELRYQRFETLRQTIQADWLVTAHTASDQVETMLMHLVRGCGLDALQGIPATRDRICRPLLTCTREEVLSYCQEHALNYVLDETNEDTRFTRNRMRNDVLPLLRKINPAVEASLLRFQNHVADDVAYLNTSASELLKSATTEDAIQTAPFVEASTVIRHRAIRLLLRKMQLTTVEEIHIRAIEQIILSNRGKTLLPDHYTAEVIAGKLTISRTTSPTPVTKLCIPVTQFPFSFTVNKKQYTLLLKNLSDCENVHTLFSHHMIDYDTIQGALYIRTREVGDTIRPAGRGFSKSVKKLMNEWKIPAENRDSFPILCDASGILMIPGCACDQRTLITDRTTRCLVIECTDQTNT